MQLSSIVCTDYNEALHMLRDMFEWIKCNTKKKRKTNEHFNVKLSICPTPCETRLCILMCTMEIYIDDIQ